MIRATDQRYMTTAEVSALTRIPIETLRYYRWLGDKGPKWFKLGRRVLYATEDVETWIAEMRGESPDAAAALRIDNLVEKYRTLGLAVTREQASAILADQGAWL